MAIIAISTEYEIHYDDASDNKPAPRWVLWDTAANDAEADSRMASTALTHPDMRLRKVRVTREVYGDDSPA